MKKLIVLPVLCLVFLSYRATAQTVSFCEDVKESGEMIHHASTFGMTDKGGILKMVVTLEKKVDAEKVVYKVFKVSKDGEQTIDQTIEDNVTPDWLWFYHELIIRTPGNYIVYVYRENSEEIIASGLLHLVPAPKSKKEN